MKLIETPIVVGSREGPKIEREATLYSCTCGSEEFFLYAVHGSKEAHLHLQCSQCDATFCRGGEACDV